MSLVGVKKSVWPPFTRTKIKLEDIQESTSLIMLAGNPMLISVSLRNDHSSLSKSFFRSIFRIMLAFGIVTGPSIGKETCLTWANDGRHDGLNPIGNDFNDQFVHCVALSYKPKILEDGGIYTLREKWTGNIQRSHKEFKFHFLMV